jgi:hypothetical protein
MVKSITVFIRSYLFQVWVVLLAITIPFSLPLIIVTMAIAGDKKLREMINGDKLK